MDYKAGSSRKNRTSFDDLGPSTSKLNVFQEQEEKDNDSLSDIEGHLLIHPGEILFERYYAIKEVGSGQFSAAWMFWDMLDKKFAVIKIVKSGPEYQDSGLREINILCKIHNSDPTDTKRHKIAEISKVFEIRDKCGTHICMVFEIIGTDLFRILKQEYPSGFPINQVKCIIRQVLEGLNYLHTTCKIIHTDIKPENILICLNDFHIRKQADEAAKINRINCNLTAFNKGSYILRNLDKKCTKSSLQSEEERTKILTERKWSSTSNVSSNKKTIKSDEILRSYKKLAEMNFSPWKESCDPFLGKEKLISVWEENINIKIIDFGSACSVDHHISNFIQTKNYRALEVIIGAEYNTSADVWSTACVAFELATGALLFNPPNEEDETHIGVIMQILGNIPTNIRRSGELSWLFFLPSGGLQNYEIEQTSLYKKLVHGHKWSPKNAEEFADFLKPMLDYDPNKRATAAECLQHPWLKM